MDPADAYVKLYDELRTVDAATLSDWFDTPQVREIADHVRLDVEKTGALPDRWMADPPVRDRSLFGVLLGLDLALLHASKQTDSLAFNALDELRVRLTMTGRLNADTSGALLFKRTTWLRPNEDPEEIDGFLNLVRVPAYLSADLHVQFVPEAYDLPDVESVVEGEELESPPPLVLAQLPFLAEPEDVEWTVPDVSAAFYNVAPASERLLPHLRTALESLDESGAVLAILPEASVDDTLFDKWCELLESTPRPDGGLLTWLMLGTGPVWNVVPHPRTGRPPNRAVLLHRSGRARLLTTQDKHSGFTFTTDKQREYKVDLGEVKRDEYISHSRQLNLLESRYGRFGIQICEDFNRFERQQYVVTAGVTHLLVPVLAAAMWTGGWQAKASEMLAVSAGVKVAVSNSLAVERFYAEKPVPTLLTVSGPPGVPEQYLTTGDLVRHHDNPNGRTMQAREDALKPRTAAW
ncbi:putative amidohydrolase [Kibdelosporangium banguiense]|uniref:Amidohydrolase n=1 Tax=Kibdelosporangium banguiense TaxID=1365924 RepID=A0ABS4U214_9PSEU|nr:hypothetical protein [Kibdelosporangium banguiense]MBP2330702.1 putative amidohydrolase [Kibdelosporangium banguiense]